MNGYSSSMPWHAVTFAYDTELWQYEKCNRIYHKKRCCASCVPYKNRVKSFLHPVPCNPVVYQSRPVQSRGISIPFRAIPWHLNPVSCIPWYLNPVQIVPFNPEKFNPVLYRPVLKISLIIPSRRIPCYLDPAGSRPETKVRPEESPETLQIRWESLESIILDFDNQSVAIVWIPCNIIPFQPFQAVYFK